MPATKLHTLTPGMIGLSYLGLAYHSNVDFSISRSEGFVSLANTDVHFWKTIITSDK